MCWKLKHRLEWWGDRHANRQAMGEVQGIMGAQSGAQSRLGSEREAEKASWRR